MRGFVFWIWSALTSLSDGLGAPPRVAVGVGLVLLAGVVAAIAAPATAAVMTHSRDRIAVLAQATQMNGRRPPHATRSRILTTHGIRRFHPLMRIIAVGVPLPVAFAFGSDSTGAYLDAWPDDATMTAYEDLVLFADRSTTDTMFIAVFGGLALASVGLVYGAARITTSWRLARPSLSYAPTFYAIACAVALAGAFVAASPLLYAYVAAYLSWVMVVAVVTALRKAPKTFVPALLAKPEQTTAARAGDHPADQAPPPSSPLAPVPTEHHGGTRAMPVSTGPAVARTGPEVVPATSPMLRCHPAKPNDPASIGPYHIHGRLGSGAMGTVYLAVSPQGEQVALKVLSPALAHDDDSRRRFFREMHALQHIHSPRVVGVLDSGVADDTPYIAMNAIDGPDLATHVRGTEPFGPTHLATLANGLAEGLAAVHEQGLVHRDVKPSNIIWSESGPCLVDFGLAHLGDQTRVTSTGLVIGSPSYVSPERLRGTTATPASDVWNWAACLAFAASGENLYRSDDPTALWQRILNRDYDRDTLDRLRVLGPQVCALAEECLRTEPAGRPRDGGELLRRYRAAAT